MFSSCLVSIGVSLTNIYVAVNPCLIVYILSVVNLHYQPTVKDLADIFGQFGQVLSANVIIDRDSGRSKGFAFVEMSNDEEARSAIDQLNGSTLEGRTIIVNEAHERPEPRNRGGGGYQSRGRRSDGGGRDGYRDRRY